MRKFICIILSLILLCCSLSACGTTTAKSDKISVVTTVFPLYDWTKQLTADADVELSMLLDNGVDMHSYQPTAKDIMDISDCDLFIYVGGESDSWVTDVLDKASNDNMVVLDLLDILDTSAKTEELVEGMQAEDEDEDDEDGEEDLDEHVWLSLRNAQVFAQEIASALSKIDTDNAALYEQNATSYVEQLKALDTEYQTAVDNSSQNTLLFGDRFPFRYLVDDYGLSYYAAFSGCSAESEASFETISFLVDKVDSLNLHSIIKLESSDGSLAETIKNSSKSKDQEILTLDSMQSASTTTDSTYLSIMESNLSVLKQALA